MSYLPIERHGVIGDLHTIALVGSDGTIDWCCMPRFDSPSIFASILDDRRGGFFRISARSRDARPRQMYLPNTNVLVTRFLTPDGVGEVVDFMPIRTAHIEHERIVRVVRGVKGEIPFRLECRPAFNYARERHTVRRIRGGARFKSPSAAMELVTPLSLDVRRDGAVRADFLLKEGDEIPVIFAPSDGRRALSQGPLARRTHQDFEETVVFWRKWISQNRYQGRWREMVQRACLTLKLLTYRPTGAIVAAPTTSLPELIGGGRNFDYRFTWIRDASFTLYGLLRVGFAEEAEQFIQWLETRARNSPDGSLQILYRIDGSSETPEEILDHLEGYQGSAPVRIGNAAAQQLQLDIYGEMMDSVYLFNKHGVPISYDVWANIRRMIDWVSKNWDRDDEGIWEVRGGPRQFTFSKLMCWVAVDRALRLADHRSFPADRNRWIELRNRIYMTIMERGWNRKLKSFVQSLDSTILDASLLITPLVKFVSPTDPRMLGTISAIRKHLVSDNLVYRYDPKLSPDGFSGREGTFSMCTFWLAEALARAGQVDEARLIFERMLGYANHLGLYAEEVGPTGEAQGNFPQAFMGLVSAAYNIDRALDGKLTY
jgi:GH15 family glucan-1,4-alpha-glucosidase